AEVRRWREVRVRVGNRGYDLTLDVSKSVSLLHALSGPEVGVAVETVFADSVVETIAAVQEWVAYGQRGHQGDDELAERIASSGLLGWVMWHQTARPVDGQAPDPHLHAHVLIANMVRGVDGRWSVSVQWRRLGADGPALVVERVSPAYIAAGGLSHGTAMTVAAAQGLTSQHTLIYGMGLDPHTLYAAMSRDRISVHLYLPRNVLESDADRAQHGEPRNPAEELHRALDAYAATLQGDRADRLLTPEPEPIAAVRARELEAIEAAAAQVVAARVALNEVTRPDRPHGLLSDEALQARIKATAARVRQLAEQVEDERRRDREQAGQVAAIRAQVQAELVDERDRLTHVLDQAHAAGSRRQDAQATHRRAEQRVTQLQAALREKNSGLRSWLPSGERTRLQEQLQEATQELAGAARRTEAATRAEQAALHAARQASPSCANTADLQARHRLLTGRTSFTTVVEKEIAARLEQVMPGFADRRRVEAARLGFRATANSLAGQHQRAAHLLATLVGERDHRRQLGDTVRRGQDHARRDPAAADLARSRREQARAQAEARQRLAAPGSAHRPPTIKGPGRGLSL
ncbi:relaxase domain-containing protein, partial [Streptosporangium sp. NPDC049248]|uniref:relaxase domain-containing protein n=1 Tax=Streptosporangium sp. NPDC049248 TaxID=3155651 RepID=UPI00343B6E5A